MSSLFRFLRPWRLRIVERDELSYLRGVARTASKLQRSHVKHGEWNARLQAKNRRLREQIRLDQAYIDDLEMLLSPTQIAQTRSRSKARRLGAEPCWCCGQPAPIRGEGDPWEGRMDGYCESCAITRCDTTDSTCAVRTAE